MADEESLERKYRLEPSPALNAKHHVASVALRADLTRARGLGEAADRALIDDVLELHEEYLNAVEFMFTAVDAGTAEQASLLRSWDGSRARASFSAIRWTPPVLPGCCGRRPSGSKALRRQPERRDPRVAAQTSSGLST